MKITPEMISEDEKRWYARDVITELGYCGNYMRDRKDMTNLDIRFYAYLMRKAHDMLKAQEPRVLTESEAEQYINSEEKYEYSDKPPLYIEYKKAQPFYIKWATFEVVCAWMKDLNMKQEYGKIFRFWTFRPSEQQMRETPWEGEKD